MQWLIAFIAACLCFWIIQHMDKTPDDPKNKSKYQNNKIILFFFIVIMFQIVFYYLDICSFEKWGDLTKTQNGGNIISDIEGNVAKMTRAQQELMEQELLRNIRQDISVGCPPF